MRVCSESKFINTRMPASPCHPYTISCWLTAVGSMIIFSICHSKQTTKLQHNNTDGVKLLRTMNFSSEIFCSDQVAPSSQE
jgi:hypothetical protein